MLRSWVPSSHLLVVAGLVSAILALPNRIDTRDDKRDDKRDVLDSRGINYTVFNHISTAASLSYVTNSGICETTPGVNQYSGYLSVGTSMCPQRYKPGKVGSCK